MNNLFEYVQALTIVNDAQEKAKRLEQENHKQGFEIARLKGKIKGFETREKLRAISLTDDPEHVSKCYKDPNFKGFKCDDCDCKEWN